MHDTLADIEAIFEIVRLFSRELTKMFEEVRRGTVTELRAQLQEREIKGEVALLVAGSSTSDKGEEAPPLQEEIQQLLTQGFSLKEIAHGLSERRGIAKREIYALGLQLKGQVSE
jgi:16S rRNA (cytidine1402-2'-O)-methyltransferase